MTTVAVIGGGISGLTAAHELAGRGLEVTVQFEESAFGGSSYFLLGAVLDQFFRRYVSINSFTETVIRLLGREKEVIRWPVRIGRRHLL